MLQFMVHWPTYKCAECFKHSLVENTSNFQARLILDEYSYIMKTDKQDLNRYKFTHCVIK